MPYSLHFCPSHGIKCFCSYANSEWVKKSLLMNCYLQHSHMMWTSGVHYNEILCMCINIWKLVAYTSCAVRLQVCTWNLHAFVSQWTNANPCLYIDSESLLFSFWLLQILSHWNRDFKNYSKGFSSFWLPCACKCKFYLIV
jgi:hypothetical protein